MVMIDIDDFKRVNDTYGHVVGDDVIRTVGQRAAAVLRPHDMVARIGGEEFGVLLPGCTPRQGKRIAERIRRAVGSSPIKARDGSMIKVTVSIGGSATCEHSAPDATVLMQASDLALYASKEAGRDRVTWHSA